MYCSFWIDSRWSIIDKLTFLILLLLHGLVECFLFFLFLCRSTSSSHYWERHQPTNSNNFFFTCHAECWHQYVGPIVWLTAEKKSGRYVGRQIGVPERSFSIIFRVGLTLLLCQCSCQNRVEIGALYRNMVVLSCCANGMSSLHHRINEHCTTFINSAIVVPPHIGHAINTKQMVLLWFAVLILLCYYYSLCYLYGVWRWIYIIINIRTQHFHSGDASRHKESGFGGMGTEAECVVGVGMGKARWKRGSRGIAPKAINSYCSNFARRGLKFLT